MAHERELALLKENKCCLKLWHFLKQCPSEQHCQKCQKPHHMWLHMETDANTSKTKAPTATKAVPTHASHSVNRHQQVLLTTCTCRVKIVALNSYMTQARAHLDSVLSTPFIAEWLTKQLCLQCTQRPLSLSRIGRIKLYSASRGIVCLEVTNSQGKGKVILVKTVVIQTVTTDHPTQPILI